MENLCHDCQAAPGDNHKPGCDVEQCPMCGGQMISCDCPDIPENVALLPWTGKWPGTVECEEFGWYCRHIPHEKPYWQRCDATADGAGPDLNRLMTEAFWDAKKQRWIKKAHN